MTPKPRQPGGLLRPLRVQWQGHWSRAGSTWRLGRKLSSGTRTHPQLLRHLSQKPQVPGGPRSGPGPGSLSCVHLPAHPLHCSASPGSLPRPLCFRSPTQTMDLKWGLITGHCGPWVRQCGLARGRGPAGRGGGGGRGSEAALAGPEGAGADGPEGERWGRGPQWAHVGRWGRGWG